MTQVKHIVQESWEFRFMVDSLDIRSAAGKKRLLNQPFLTREADIEEELALIAETIHFLEKEQNAPVFEAIGQDLSQLRDIHATIAHLAQGAALDDIGLFEIKHFALAAGQIAGLFRSIGCAVLDIPPLDAAADILDPEGQGIPQFYIYAAYSPELADVRRLIQAGEEALRAREEELEDAVREDLCARLRPWAAPLQTALEALAHADLLLAKARQAIEMGLCRPEISPNQTEYAGLFHPTVKYLLEKEGKTFQPVDISLGPAPVLITGANMGGKTVLLKSLCLAQYLFQFGFYVPARAARIMVVEEVFLSQPERQAETQGLSSFAFEMKNVNQLIVAVKSGRKVLALIDELARTTNPDEGKAIVRAVLDFLQEYEVCSVVTTHYGGIESDCRKLRVKGLKTEGAEGKIRFERLNELMDYSLVEADGAGPVSEGIRIAEILGVDEELIEKAKWYFEKDNN